MENNYHFVYKITNLINNKIYIGVHSTDILDDGYLGKGSLIVKAVKKYGKENFKRDILKFFNTREEAFEEERKLVDKDFILLESNYNLKTGGEGGAMYGKRNPMYGKTYSKTDKEKAEISLRFKNKEKTENHKHKLSLSQLGSQKNWVSKRQKALMPWEHHKIKNCKSKLRKFADMDLIYDYWIETQVGVKALANWYKFATYNELTSVMRFIKSYGDPRLNDKWIEFKEHYEY